MEQADTIKKEKSRQIRSKTAKMLGKFFDDKLAIVGAFVFIFFVIVSILAPIISPHDPLGQNLRYRFDIPGGEFLLGTDMYGRDVLSRLIYGSRTTLIVGTMSILFSMVVGTLIGTLSGYLGGAPDRFISQCVDVLMAFPSLLLGLIVVIVFGSGITNVIIAIAISMFPRFVRLSRGSTLSIREKEFISGAKALGLPTYRIVVFHIIPNLLGSTIIMSTLWVATAIRIEASLSFLGLGVQPPTPTWGNMIRDGMNYIFNAPWLVLFPGIAICLLILSLNMIGDGLRDSFDPTSSG